MASLSLAEAESILASAKAKIAEMGVKMSVSVLDARGDLKAMVRTDGAHWRTPYISQAKAVASATWGQSSAEMAERANTPLFQSFMAMQGGRFMPSQGALPLYKDGEVVGAVGASGGSADEDEAVVKAAIEGAGLSVNP